MKKSILSSAKSIIVALVAAVGLAIPQNADASVTFNGHTYANSQSVSCSTSPCNWSETVSTSPNSTQPLFAINWGTVSGTCSLTEHFGGYDSAVKTFTSSVATSEVYSGTAISSASWGFTTTGCTYTATVYF